MTPAARPAVAARVLALIVALNVAAAHATSRPTALSPLLGLFEAVHAGARVDPAQAEALSLAAQAQRAEASPSFSLSEALAWRGYETLELGLTLGATLPLYRSRAEPLAALLRHRAEALAASAEATAAAERARFVSDSIALAVALAVEHDARAALARFEADAWPPQAEPEAVARLAPAERELLSLRASVEALAGFAGSYAEQLAARLERTAALPAGSLPLPTVAGALEALRSTPPTVAACLATAPEALAAERRHGEHLLSRVVDGTVDFELSLSGQLTHRLAWAATPEAHAQASLGLQARVALPDGWPVSGDASLTTGLAGAEQRLTLTWPPARRNGPAAGALGAEAEAGARLDDDLADLADHAHTLLRSLAEAEGALLGAETRLLWFAHDAREEARGAAASPAAMDEPLADPVLNLRAVTLRSDVAFARLALATAYIDLQLFCGFGELGARAGAGTAR